MESGREMERRRWGGKEVRWKEGEEGEGGEVVVKSGRRLWGEGGGRGGEGG